MRLHPRAVVFGCVLAMVTNLVVIWALTSAPALAAALGADSSTWVNGFVVVELVRMCAVAAIALLAIRQRDGLLSRAEGMVNALTVAAVTWVVSELIVLVIALVAGGTLFDPRDLLIALVWLAGAALAPVFVTPREASRTQNRYIERLDRERAESW